MRALAGPRLRAAVVAFAGLLVSCANSPRIDPQQEATLKAFEIGATRSGIFVTRDPKPESTVVVDLMIDRLRIGRVRPGTFLFTEVAPRRHVVRVTGDPGPGLEFESEAGRFVFIHVTVDEQAPAPFLQRYWTPQIRLALQQESEGRARVLASSLAEAPAASVAVPQTIDVRLQADRPAPLDKLACIASNDLGQWPFAAPGPVTVLVSEIALRIECNAVPGWSVEPRVVGARSLTQEQLRRSVKGGTIVGAVTGAALGTVLGGPAIGVLFGVGGAARGAEVGGIAGVVATGGAPFVDSEVIAYPDSVELEVRSDPATVEPSPTTSPGQRSTPRGSVE